MFALVVLSISCLSVLVFSGEEGGQDKGEDKEEEGGGSGGGSSSCRRGNDNQATTKDEAPAKKVQ